MPDKVDKVLQELLKQVKDSAEALQKLEEHMPPEQLQGLQSMVERLKTMGSSITGTQQTIQETQKEHNEEQKKRDLAPSSNVGIDPTQSLTPSQDPALSMAQGPQPTKLAPEGPQPDPILSTRPTPERPAPEPQLQEGPQLSPADKAKKMGYDIPKPAPSDRGAKGQGSFTGMDLRNDSTQSWNTMAAPDSGQGVSYPLSPGQPRPIPGNSPFKIPNIHDTPKLKPDEK